MNGKQSILSLLCLLLLLGCPSLSLARSSAANLQDTINRNKERAQKSRDSLNKLTKQERSLYGDLAKVEDTLVSLRRDIMDGESQLAAIDDRLATAKVDHNKLVREQTAARKELSTLAQKLWPLRVAALKRDSTLGASWDEADRKFTWGATVYDSIERTLATIQARETAIKDSIDNQEELRAKAAQHIDAIDAKQGELLTRRLDFVRNIRKIRAKRYNEEQALEQVLTAIDDLNFRLKGLGADRFSKIKGGLPSPVRGKRFKPGKDTPRRKGVGYRTKDFTPVSAVYWGKVVHNDILRGFGHVVILSHGENYYSLYAFLENPSVTLGQEVEKGEPIGSTGFYPDAKGSGLYFELRFGQKAINPVLWLANR